MSSLPCIFDSNTFLFFLRILVEIHLQYYIISFAIGAIIIITTSAISTPRTDLIFFLTSNDEVFNSLIFDSFGCFSLLAIVFGLKTLKWVSSKPRRKKTKEKLYFIFFDLHHFILGSPVQL